MQIREQGRKIQFLKSVYDPVLKRCIQEQLGSINRYGDKQLSPELLAKLSKEELQQFNAWVVDEKQNTLKNHNWYEVRHAEARILTITNAIGAAGNVDQLKIDSLKSAIRGLQKVVRKAEKNLKSASL